MTYNNNIRELARYQWRVILPALGIPANSLTNKHQPCPCCGGRDRFRFDDLEGSGSFICTHYGNGGGDGFHLVQHWLDCDFNAAVKSVKDVLGGEDATPIIRPRIQPTEPPKDRIASLMQVWNESRLLEENDDIAAYMDHRGLASGWHHGLSKNTLRFHPDLPYWSSEGRKPRIIGKYSAMVARITNAKDETQGLHLTYLENGHKLDIEGQPAKKMRSRYRGALRGCAIRLCQPTDKLAVCEGIETALAVRQITGLPVWACLSAHGLQTLEMPQVEHLYIYCDNDCYRQGYQAGRTLAQRAIKAGIKSYISEPETVGNDWLDELNQEVSA